MRNPRANYSKLKVIDGIDIVRSSTIAEILSLNTDKDYDLQMCTGKRSRNTNSI